MEHQLPALPYAKDALAPHMSAETFDYHPQERVPDEHEGQQQAEGNRHLAHDHP